MTIRIYLKLSSKDQDVELTKKIIEESASKNNLDLEGACYYIESNPGRKWSRPELDKLIEQSQLGDILLLERISDLTRLTLATWNDLKASIDGKGLKTVACDIPITFKLLEKSDDAVHQKVIESVNIMMNEFLEAAAPKDYDERLKRQSVGIKHSSHKPVGRPSNPDTSKKCESVYEAVETKSMSVAKALKKYGVSKATYYRWQAKQSLTASTDQKVALSALELPEPINSTFEAYGDISSDEQLTSKALHRKEDISDQPVVCQKDAHNTKDTKITELTFANYKEVREARSKVFRELKQKLLDKRKGIKHEPVTPTEEELARLIDDISFD